jgi:hypothetical protein
MYHSLDAAAIADVTLLKEGIQLYDLNDKIALKFKSK